MTDRRAILDRPAYQGDNLSKIYRMVAGVQPCAPVVNMQCQADVGGTPSAHYCDAERCVHTGKARSNGQILCDKCWENSDDNHGEDWQ